MPHKNATPLDSIVGGTSQVSHACDDPATVGPNKLHEDMPTSWWCDTPACLGAPGEPQQLSICQMFECPAQTVLGVGVKCRICEIGICRPLAMAPLIHLINGAFTIISAYGHLPWEVVEEGPFQFSLHHTPGRDFQIQLAHDSLPQALCHTMLNMLSW